MFLPPLVGHDGPLTSLRRAMSRGRLGHAYLFVGPDGIGKRRTAIHVAQGLLCETNPHNKLDPCGRCAGCKQVVNRSHPDYFEVQRPADKNVVPIDSILDLCGKLSLKPARGIHKVAIVDDADLLNEEAANCFLKSLEEPPPGSLLILIASSAESQLATIVSRCQVLRFGELTARQVGDVLQSLAAAPETQQSLDPATIALAQQAVAVAGGSVGWALELAQPEWRTIRAMLVDRLSSVPVQSVALTRDVADFVEAAGTEAAARRFRTRQVVRLVVGFYEATLRQLLHPTSFTADDPDQPYRRRLAQAVDADTLTELLDRCLQADFHIGRFLNQSLALTAWIDDLAQISAGHAASAVGRSMFDY